MVESVIKMTDTMIPYKEVTASRGTGGKSKRAEPVAALYEQGRVSHIGELSDLEDQLCQFTPDGYLGEGSPDRVDALVWAMTDLLVEHMSDQGLFELYRKQAEALAAKKAPVKKEITYAIGSMEWQEQQRQLKGET